MPYTWTFEQSAKRLGTGTTILDILEKIFK